MRKDRVVEGVLPAKHHAVDKKKDFFKQNQVSSNGNTTNKKIKGREERKTFHLVNIVTEKVIHLSYVGGDQMQNAASATRWGMKL